VVEALPGYTAMSALLIQICQTKYWKRSAIATVSQKTAISVRWTLESRRTQCWSRKEVEASSRPRSAIALICW